MSTPTPASLRSLFLLLGLAAASFSAPALHAMGSPPLITDDPDVPGDGHWEINVGLSTEHRPDATSSELPLIDLNYGIGDRIQLKYEVPYLSTTESGGPSLSGLGNSEFGVKYRFYDGGEKGLAVSVYPQWEFNNPGSSSADKGLVEHGSAFKLPFQLEREFGPLDVVVQVGREFHSDGDSWFYGFAVSHKVADKVDVGVELAGTADAGLHRSVLATNLGIVIELSERTSFMFSVGRELHNHDELKATFLGYVGMQWRL